MLPEEPSEFGARDAILHVVDGEIESYLRKEIQVGEVGEG